MAEARLLKKKASRDPQLAQLTDRSALLYILSIPHLDVEGRMVGLPAQVRGLVVPAIAAARPNDWTDDLVGSYIYEWTATTDRRGNVDPLVLWYAVDGENVLAFTGFARNQTIRRDREAPSRLPAPPPGLLEKQTALAPAGLALSPAPAPARPATPGLKEKDQEEHSTTGLSVAHARARSVDMEGLQIADLVESSLSESAQPVSTSGFASRPAGDLRLPLDDLDRLAATLRGSDAGTAHLLRVWQRRGCGEREFAIARESLEARRRRPGRPLESEARYFCAELARALREREAAA